jgi:hypothetical protein
MSDMIIPLPAIAESCMLHNYFIHGFYLQPQIYLNGTDVEAGSTPAASLSAYFLVKGSLCQATLNSTGLAIAPSRGWKCRIRNLEPLHGDMPKP